MPDLGVAPPLGGGQAGSGLAVAGGLMIGLATVVGARPARRHARWELCFGAAAGALLVIAGVHLLPDAWSAARQAALPAGVPRRPPRRRSQRPGT